jgi:hypothetical protein
VSAYPKLHKTVEILTYMYTDKKSTSWHMAKKKGDKVKLIYWVPKLLKFPTDIHINIK